MAFSCRHCMVCATPSCCLCHKWTLHHFRSHFLLLLLLLAVDTSFSLSLSLSPCSSSPPHMSQLTPPFTLQRQQLCVDWGGRREGGTEGLRGGRREIVGSDDFFEGN